MAQILFYNYQQCTNSDAVVKCSYYILTNSNVDNIGECVNCIANAAIPFAMKNKLILLFLLSLGHWAHAQQPFTEGTVNYKVVFENNDHKTFSGTYCFTVKNGQVRKELTLSNGFQDIVLINTNNNTVYSLRTARNGKKFAIQLSLDELKGRQEQYRGFVLKEQNGKPRQVAGMTEQKGTLQYKNGKTAEISYTDKWYMEPGITYERFPEARFLPLAYSYIDEAKGFTMHMEAITVSSTPVENSLFRLPADYRVISNEEYKQLSSQ